MKLAAETFSYFIRNTAFAITNEQSRFTLSGAKFIIADGVAKMVTTDGHRLAYVEQASTTKTPLDTLVPRKALLELVKLARNDGDISFGEDPNHIYLRDRGTPAHHTQALGPVSQLRDGHAKGQRESCRL